MELATGAMEILRGCALISRYLRWRGVLWLFGAAVEEHTSREAPLRDGIPDLVHTGESQVLKIGREREKHMYIYKERERERVLNSSRDTSRRIEGCARTPNRQRVRGGVRSCGHVSPSCATRVHTSHVDRTEINDNRGETRGIHVALSGNGKSV